MRTKVAGNCMKWTDPVSEFFPIWPWGGGGLFCQLNQSCWKLCEMDRSSLRIFPCLAMGKGRGGGGFSAQCSGIIIFSMELYYGNQLCSKCIRKSFVSFPVNNIQAYKYNILMILQSAIASTVTVIAGILVCIVVRLPIGLPSAP